MSFDPETRKSAIWSTEAAGALGLSDRTTQAQLWAEKRGLMERPDSSDNIAARLGLACQEGVARLHVEDTGDKLIPLADVALLRDVQGVPMGSHFDYYNASLKRLHEVKFFALTRAREFGEPGSDTVPYDVLVQALHEMAVWNADNTGYGPADACEVNVVFGNIMRAVFVIPNDQAAREKLLREEAAFWALVQSDTPPEPKSTEDARRIWAKSDGSEKTAEPTTLQACTALGGLKKQIKALEAQEEALALYIQRAMESAHVLKDQQGHVLCTWKDVSTERVDVKRLRAELPEVAAQYLNAASSRRFLLKG